MLQHSGRPGRLYVPELYIPKTREIEVPKVELGMSGHYTVELIEAATGRIKRKLEFKNLITNGGLDFLGGGTGSGSLSAALSYLEVGTGTTTPANADASLVSAVSPRTNSNGGFTDVVGTDGGTGYVYRRVTRVFTESQVNTNLTELGFWSASSLGTLFNRQLFKDGLGSPTVITKTSSDQLRVTLELRLYPPQTDVTGSFVIAGNTHNYTLRAQSGLVAGFWAANVSSVGAPYGLGNWSTSSNLTRVEDASVLSAWSAQPSAPVAQTDASSTTLSTYGSGNYYRDISAVYDPALANWTNGIGRVQLWRFSGSHDFLFQMSITPRIFKVNTQRLTINYRCTWGRYP